MPSWMGESIGAMESRNSRRMERPMARTKTSPATSGRTDPFGLSFPDNQPPKKAELTFWSGEMGLPFWARAWSTV